MKLLMTLMMALSLTLISGRVFASENKIESGKDFLTKGDKIYKLAGKNYREVDEKGAVKKGGGCIKQQAVVGEKDKNYGFAATLDEAKKESKAGSATGVGTDK